MHCFPVVRSPIFLFLGLGERHVPQLQHPPRHAQLVGKSQTLGKGIFVAVMAQGKQLTLLEPTLNL